MKPFFVFRYKKEKNMVKVDVNRDYNLYYTPDGERLDEGVCEAVDTNDYYGSVSYTHLTLPTKA